MEILSQIGHNRVLWVSVLGWFVAQALKIVFTFISEGRLDFKRIVGLGGMPSSHSSVVCALATATGIAYGFDTVEFAICAVLATIVMTDAAGVRRAAGKQARQINRIVQDMIESGRGLTYETMKELLGHSPFEVVVGAILGILIAIIAM